MEVDQEETWRAAGQRIKEVRVAAGLSQEELAMDADWDQSTLSKVERLGPHMVLFNRLEALGAALECEVDVTLLSDKEATSRVERHMVPASLRKLAKSKAAIGCVVDVTFRPKAGAAPRGNPGR